MIRAAHDLAVFGNREACTALFSRRQVFILLFAALALRLAYIALVVAFGGNIDNGSDSGKFLQLAYNLREFGALVNWDKGVFGLDTGRMPLYPYFLADVFDIVGEQRLWVVSLIQAFIDAGTIFAIGLLAGAFNRRWAVPAAVLACVWTSLIVYTSFVLTDTIFMAFFCWGLCACVWAVRKLNRALPLIVLAGVAFACGVLTRPTLMFFPYFLFPALAVLLWFSGGKVWWRALMLAAIPGVFIIGSVVPRVAAIHAEYGSAVVTTQSGIHALDVVDQFTRLCEQCVAEGREAKMREGVKTRFAARSAEDQTNPTVLDSIRRDVAVEYLKKIPVTVLIGGTVMAAVRSTLQSGLYETGHQFNLDPRFISSIPGDSMGERLTGFAKVAVTDGFLVAWTLAQAIAVLGLILQLTGTVTGIRNRDVRPYILFLLAVGAYFLAVNGPFGNPRYGMPLTPVLVILTAIGVVALVDRYAGAKPATDQSGD